MNDRPWCENGCGGVSGKAAVRQLLSLLLRLQEVVGVRWNIGEVRHADRGVRMRDSRIDVI